MIRNAIARHWTFFFLLIQALTICVCPYEGWAQPFQASSFAFLQNLSDSDSVRVGSWASSLIHLLYWPLCVVRPNQRSRLIWLLCISNTTINYSQWYRSMILIRWCKRNGFLLDSQTKTVETALIADAAPRSSMQHESGMRSRKWTASQCQLSIRPVFRTSHRAAKMTAPP